MHPRQTGHLPQVFPALGHRQLPGLRAVAPDAEALAQHRARADVGLHERPRPRCRGSSSACSRGGVQPSDGRTRRDGPRGLVGPFRV